MSKEGFTGARTPKDIPCSVVYDLQIVSKNDSLSNSDIKALCAKMQVLGLSTSKNDEYQSTNLKLRDSSPDKNHVNKLTNYLQNLGCDVQVKGRYSDISTAKPPQSLAE
jgi:hypothetical protein